MVAGCYVLLHQRLLWATWCDAYVCVTGCCGCLSLTHTYMLLHQHHTATTYYYGRLCHVWMCHIWMCHIWMCHIWMCHIWMCHILNASHCRVTWLIHMCDMTHWYVWHDSYESQDTVYVCTTTRSHVSCDGVVSHMHESCVRSLSEWCKCSWLFHIFVTNEAYDAFTCDTTHSYATNIWTSPSHMFPHLVSGLSAKLGSQWLNIEGLMTKGFSRMNAPHHICIRHGDCVRVSCLSDSVDTVYIYIDTIYVYICIYIYRLLHMWRCDLWLQHTATHCDTLQHTATHCNTLQHTAKLFICDTSHIYVMPIIHRPHRTVYDMICMPTERHHCCM